MSEQIICCFSGFGFNPEILSECLSASHEFDGYQFVPIDYLSFSFSSLIELTPKIAPKLHECCILLGCSFGGLIAILLAYYFPNKIKKLILLASTLCFLEKEG